MSHPEICPVTGRPFFMSIEHAEDDGVFVPTYGGPYDSYTLPEWDPEDQNYYHEHFCHDRGRWMGTEAVFTNDDEAIEARIRELEAELAGLRAALEEMRNG